MFYVLEIETPSMGMGTKSDLDVCGVGETALAAQQDAMAYLLRCSGDVGVDPASTWEDWQDMAGDSSYMLVTMELAVLPQEWQVKPCDNEG